MTHRSRTGGPPKTHRKGPAGSSSRGRKLHHPPPPPPSSEPSPSTSSSISCPATLLQNPTDQQILDLIYASLRSTIASPDFIPTIQTIKGLLYDEKWLEVFEDEALLEAYAGRWVPSRALCFRELMGSLEEVRSYFWWTEERGERNKEENDDADQQNDGSDNGEGPVTGKHPKLPPRVLSLGGGAGSELVALAALLRSMDESSSSSASAGSAQTVNGKGKERANAMEERVSWTGVDIGSWSNVLSLLGESTESTWKSGSGIDRKYFQLDLLDPELSETLARSLASSTTSISDPSFAQHLQLAPPTFITLLFTLTELLSQSPQRTISLLTSLSAHIPPGSLFLVADSASDIAEFELAGRTWPTFVMIDLIMTKLISRGSDPGSKNGGIEPEGEKAGPAWEKLRGEDSRWFRLSPGTGNGWPVKLENARYWYRLYRKL